MGKGKLLTSNINKEKDNKIKVKENVVLTKEKTKEVKDIINEFTVIGYKNDKVLINVNGFTIALKVDKKIYKKPGHTIKVRHKGITNKNELKDYKVLG